MNEDTQRIPEKGNRLFQIYEDDLAELERSIPFVSDMLMPHLTTPMKVRLRRVKDILSNVRWNYGPPEKVEVIPADGEPPHGCRARGREASD